MEQRRFLPAGFFLISLVYCGGSTEIVPNGDGGPGSSSGAGSSGVASSGATSSGGSSSGTTSSGASSSGGSSGGSSTSSSSSGSSGSSSGSLPDSGCVANPQPAGGLPARVPTQHRATATACSHSSCGPAPLDGGACNTDSDCAVDSGSPYWTARCLQGACTWDRCISDSDCGTNEMCLCASTYYGGNACHVNVCIPASCHVDLDCGPGGYCAPSIGYCGAPQQYNCIKPTDPCVNPTTDCSCKSSFGSVPAACVYDPSSHQFVCGEQSICAG